MHISLKLILFDLIIAVVVIAFIQLAGRAFLRANPEKADTKNMKVKLFFFSLVVALLAIAFIQLAGRAFLHREPPPTVAALMAELEIPAIVPADALREAVQDNFLTRFGGIYGIDPEPAETAYFMKLMKDNPIELEQEGHLHEAIRKECARRGLSEETLIRQLIRITDPDEKAKIRKEWITAGLAAVVESETFIHAMEPVYVKFYAWWTKRHPEYEGIASGITITDDHEILLDQVAVSLRRELLVRMAQELEVRLETDLRKRGKALSEAKRKKAFAAFLRLSRERYTQEMMRRMAESIVKEAELTDDEILHCLIMKTRALPEERLSKIQDVQLRFMAPRELDEIPEEVIISIRKDLEEITGVEYGAQ